MSYERKEIKKRFLVRLSDNSTLSVDASYYRVNDNGDVTFGRQFYWETPWYSVGPCQPSSLEDTLTLARGRWLEISLERSE